MPDKKPELPAGYRAPFKATPVMPPRFHSSIYDANGILFVVEEVPGVVDCIVYAMNEVYRIKKKKKKLYYNAGKTRGPDNGGLGGP